MGGGKFRWWGRSSLPKVCDPPIDPHPNSLGLLTVPQGREDTYHPIRYNPGTEIIEGEGYLMNTQNVSGHLGSERISPNWGSSEMHLKSSMMFVVLKWISRLRNLTQ